MDERGGGHEQVVTSLMDLQARLRGEEPEERPEEEAPKAEAAAIEADAVEHVLRLPDVDDVPAARAEEAAAAPEPEPPAVEAPPEADPEPDPIVTVDVPTIGVVDDPPEEVERFAPVTPLRAGLGADDRLAGFVERLAQLESSIDEVSQRADRREDDRSDRLVSLEQRLLHEVASQRQELLTAIDDRFVRIDRALREGLAALHAAIPDDAPDRGEPA